MVAPIRQHCSWYQQSSTTASKDTKVGVKLNCVEEDAVPFCQAMISWTVNPKGGFYYCEAISSYILAQIQHSQNNCCASVPGTHKRSISICSGSETMYIPV